MKFNVNYYKNQESGKGKRPKQEWDKYDNEGSEANARALFSIFNRVCLDQFRKIANFTRVKETWDIL